MNASADRSVPRLKTVRVWLEMEFSDLLFLFSAGSIYFESIVFVVIIAMDRMELH